MIININYRYYFDLVIEVINNDTLITHNKHLKGLFISMGKRSITTVYCVFIWTKGVERVVSVSYYLKQTGEHKFTDIIE